MLKVTAPCILAGSLFLQGCASMTVIDAPGSERTAVCNVVCITPERDLAFLRNLALQVLASSKKTHAHASHASNFE